MMLCAFDEGSEGGVAGAGDAELVEELASESSGRQRSIGDDDDDDMVSDVPDDGRELGAVRKVACQDRGKRRERNVTRRKS